VFTADVDIRNESDGDAQEADQLPAVAQFGLNQVQGHLRFCFSRNGLKLFGGSAAVLPDFSL
jgi:hypothetical protein